MASVYALQHGGVDPASLYDWQRRVRAGVAELEDISNPRNKKGHSRGRYAVEERRTIVEAFEKSGLGQRDSPPLIIAPACASGLTHSCPNHAAQPGASFPTWFRGDRK